MIKKFEQYVDEAFSINNGLRQNPERQTKELLRFNEVLPEIVDRISSETGLKCFADYKCYPYEEHVFANIGCINGDDEEEILGSVEFSELDNPDEIIKRFTLQK